MIVVVDKQHRQRPSQVVLRFFLAYGDRAPVICKVTVDSESTLLALLRQTTGQSVLMMG